MMSKEPTNLVDAYLDVPTANQGTDDTFVDALQVEVVATFQGTASKANDQERAEVR